MVNLEDSVRNHCSDLDPDLIDMHFRRLPPAYFESYSASEIGKHLHLLARVSPQQPVEVEIRPLAAQAFAVTVVGIDHSGTLACITAALAAQGFDLEDVQVSIYLDGEAASSTPCLFVILLRVSGSLQGRAILDLTAALRERLAKAFFHLAQGDFLEAQAAAAETQLDDGQPKQRSSAAGSRKTDEYEGLAIGGEFRLDRKMAIGGMSEVYLATQLSLNRTVAVKVFRQEDADDENSLARFNQEALVLGQFNCAHIVQIFAAGTAPDAGGRNVAWMAMEYMAGGDLAQWVQGHGPQPGELGLRWLRQALEGLAYAHRHRILHLDLKPHNLLLSGEGHLKVSDFGLLKRLRKTSAPRAETSIVGTPQYMSPEQAQGEVVDERSDIFSLGTTFFYILSGQMPFQATDTTAFLNQLKRSDAPRLADITEQVPVPLSVIIGRMMARRRDERYQDVNVILEDLASYERRGLLIPYQGEAFSSAVVGPPVERPDVETQAYQPAPQAYHDL